MRLISHDPHDVEPSLWGEPVGVLGYGNQGRAQAWNLREAGMTVLVGARAGGAGEKRAREEGFQALEPSRLGERCAVVALLTPDSTHGRLLASLRACSKVRVVVVAHGFELRFGDPPLAPEWDVVLVAPSGPGTALRRASGPGRVPALIAVHRDASGRARGRAASYAVAAGCDPAALFETTVAQEAETDLFGEQAVLCGGLTALVTAAWETLVEAGYDPEAAYLECVQQVGLTSEMITRFGIAGMRERISDLALFGDLTRGPRVIGPKVREAMAEILLEIRDGRFAREWSLEVASGLPRNRAGIEDARRHPLEQKGARVRERCSRPEDRTEGGGAA